MEASTDIPLFEIRDEDSDDVAEEDIELCLGLTGAPLLKGEGGLIPLAALISWNMNYSHYNHQCLLFRKFFQ